MKVLVTGGAGFIGSNFLNLFVPEYPQHLFIHIDKLTYAANLSNLKDMEFLPNYYFEKTCIADLDQVMKLFQKYDPDLIIHFAAESHVDRSITGPAE